MPKTKKANILHNGVKPVGRFHVEFEIANYGDLELSQRGKLAKEEVRHATILGVVDSGAASLVLPQRVAEQLGLRVSGKVRVKYANGRIALRDKAQGASVALQGRNGVFSAVLEPKRDTALIGAIVLEELDFLVDNKKQRLVPRDPNSELYEIE